MKFRASFVSNSSSSSFIVVNYNDKLEIPEKYLITNTIYNTLSIPNDLDKPHYQFGWEYKMYDRFEDKLCWALLQAQYADGEIYIVETSKKADDNSYNQFMLFDVLKEYLHCGEIVTQLNVYDRKYFDAYIDHQSISNECFKNRDTLIKFLFNPDSYVSGGNDNEDGYRDSPEHKTTFKEKATNMYRESIIRKDVTIETLSCLIDIARDNTQFTHEECIRAAFDEYKKYVQYKEKLEVLKHAGREFLEELAIKQLKKEIYGAD